MRRYTITDLVWLTTLRGATLEEAWQAAMQNAGHHVSRDYVARLRSDLNWLIRRRQSSGG